MYYMNRISLLGAKIINDLKGPKLCFLPFSLDLSGKFGWNEHFLSRKYIQFTKNIIDYKWYWENIAKNII